MVKVILAQESIILAMQSLPESNLSATFKNLSLLFSITEEKFPFSSTSEYLFNMLILGILTLLNAILNKINININSILFIYFIY